MHRHLKDLFYILLLAAIIVTFMWFVGKDITAFGSQYDEAWRGSMAIGIMNNEYDAAYVYLNAFGRRWPVMHKIRDGFPLQNYIIMMFFAIYEPGLLVMRMAGLCILSLFILAGYCLCRLWYGKRAAFISIVLMAVSPTFTTSKNFLIYNKMFMVLFFIISMILLTLWYKNKKLWMLFSGGFILGMGLSISLAMLYFIMALLVCYLLLFRKTLEINLSQKFIFILSVIAGNFGMLLNFIFAKLNYFKVFYECLTGSSLSGVDNLAYLTNLNVRVKQLWLILQGRANEWTVGVIEGNVFFPYVFLCSGVLLLLMCICKKCEYGKKGMFAVLFPLLVFLQTPFTVTTLLYDAVMVLWPFPDIIIALCVSELWRYFDNKRLYFLKGTVFRYGFLGRVLLIFLILFLVGAQLRVGIGYLSELRKTQGVFLWSKDAGEGLAEYLLKNKIKSPVCLSWGIMRNIHLLTRGECRPVEAFSRKEPSEKLKSFWRERIKDSSNVYILAGGAVRRRKGFENFKDFVETEGKQVNLEKEFYDRAGNRVFEVYKICNK